MIASSPGSPSLFLLVKRARKREGEPGDEARCVKKICTLLGAFSYHTKFKGFKVQFLHMHNIHLDKRAVTTLIRYAHAL